MRRKTVFLIFMVVLFLAIAKIFLSAKMATVGGDLARVEKQKQVLGEQNRLLEAEIASSASLLRISQEAPKLGFLPRKEIVNLTLEVPIALGR